MTSEEFQAWIDEMKNANLVQYDSDLAELLGVTNGTFIAMKKGKTPINRRTALACNHLRLGGKPYPEGK